MADEITVSASLKCVNGNYTAYRSVTRLQVTQATLGGQGNVQTIGTSYEAIVLGDVSAEGYVYIRNLDDTNFVQIGLDAGAALTPVARLDAAGGVALFRLDAAATLFAESDTAACKIDVLILEA
jgi:hypothetical protein